MLSAFRFVEEHTEPGQTPKWGELTKRWNQRHPDDRFWDRSALRRAHRRAEKWLAPPRIDGQGGAEEEEKEGAAEADIFEPEDPS